MAGQLIQKSDDYWLLRIYKGRDPLTKQRIYKAAKFEGSREQAQTELDKLVQEQADHAKAKSSDITVNEHFDQWFDQVAENRYSYKTMKNYRGIIGFDVRPIVGQMKLSDLQPTHIQCIFSGMTARGACSNTRRRLHSVISNALDCAVAWGTLKMNPMARVEIPRQEVKDMRCMSQEEVKGFLEVTDSGLHAEYFRTAVVTGMRPGELAGLCWPDIDFKNATISVQRSLVWRGKVGEGWFLEPTKTERGRREITIPDSLVNALSELKKATGRAHEVGRRPLSKPRIRFCQQMGKPRLPWNLRKECVQSGLGTCGFTQKNTTVRPKTYLRHPSVEGWRAH